MVSSTLLCTAVGNLKPTALCNDRWSVLLFFGCIAVERHGLCLDDDCRRCLVVEIGKLLDFFRWLCIGRIRDDYKRRRIRQLGHQGFIWCLSGNVIWGSKEALASSHFGEVLPPMQAGKDLRTQRFMWREMMEQRFIRITRGSVLGGARLGVFTAIFCGAQWYYAREFDIHGTWNVVSAGSTTAAAFGLALPGSVPSRIRAAALGSVLGATFCLPLGYLQTTLKLQAEEAEAAEAKIKGPSAAGGEPEIDGITATIRRLERS